MRVLILSRLSSTSSTGEALINLTDNSYLIAVILSPSVCCTRLHKVRLNTVTNVVTTSTYWDLRGDAGCGEAGCYPRLAHVRNLRLCTNAFKVSMTRCPVKIGGSALTYNATDGKEISRKVNPTLLDSDQSARNSFGLGSPRVALTPGV